jgi:hypothetical protein
MDADKVRGLIRSKAGLNLAAMGEKLAEDGYFRERPSERELLDAIDAELRGHKRYSERDLDALARHREAAERNAELDRLITDHGIETEGKTKAQVLDEIAEKMSQERQAREIASQTGAHEAALREAEERAAEARGDAFEPQPEAGTVPRTMEDIERERQTEIAARTGQSPGVAEASGPLGWESAKKALDHAEVAMGLMDRQKPSLEQEQAKEAGLPAESLTSKPGLGSDALKA